MTTATPLLKTVGLIVMFLLSLSQVGCRCFENCRFPGRRSRDVGRVQNNVGPGYSEVFPRTAVQPFSPAVLNGPAVPPTNVAQGNRLEVAGPPIGAQVPVASSMDGLPPGAIDPLPPNARPFPNPAAAPQPVVAAGPTMIANPQPAMVPMIPTAPMVMTQPVPMAIPVVFQSPVTRSTTVPIGTAIPMTATPVPGGMIVQAQPGMAVPAASVNGLAPNYAQGGFLSGNNTGGLRLQPRMAGDSTPRPSAPSPERPRSAAPDANRPRPTDRPSIRPDNPSTPAPRSTPVPDRPPVPAVPEGIPLPTGPTDPLPPPPKVVPKGDDPSKLEEPSIDEFLPKLSIPDAPNTSP